MRALTTTSYAILGWLDVRPWTTYELARQLQRNLAFFWPRTASRLFDEPKNLAERGLVRAEAATTGRRPKTLYTITDEGRQALRRWQATPCALPALEFEGLTRVFFGAAATPDQLVSAVKTAEQLADLIQEQGRMVASEYLSGRYPYPERVHLSALTFDFLWSYAEMLRDWSKRSSEEIVSWGDTEPDAGKQERAFSLFESRIRA